MNPLILGKGHFSPADLEHSATTELVNITSDSSVMSKELPWKFVFHCITYFNTTHGIITGGLDTILWGSTTCPHNMTETWFVRFSDFYMTMGPKMSSPRTLHSCSKIQHPNGTSYVVVSGGYRNPLYEETNNGSTEYLKIGFENDLSGWSEGPQMPGVDCTDGTMITTPNGQEIIMTGCIDHNVQMNLNSYVSGTYTGKVFRLSWIKNDLHWSVMKTQLQFSSWAWPQRSTSIMWIPNKIAKCHFKKCYVHGECSGSKPVEKTTTSSAELCVIACRKNPDCYWTSFIPKMINNCKMFKTCPHIKKNQCDHCVTNQKNCSCVRNGKCVGGRFIETKVVSIMSECNDLCKEDKACFWSTFKSDSYTCDKFVTCGELQTLTCKECQTYSKNCFYPLVGNSDVSGTRKPDPIRGIFTNLT